MKERVAALIEQALTALADDALAGVTLPDSVALERTRDPKHGDFASNVALTLAKAAGMPPRKLAEKIVAALPPGELIARVDIAGPGFINFTLARGVVQRLIFDILDAGETFGRSDVGEGERVIVEFVSANPTGPLHVGHGRGAAYGACVAELLAAAGYDVYREYYVNDAGRQMDILAVSVWLRYLEARSGKLPFPAGGYRGDYIRDIADDLARRHGDAFARPRADVLSELPDDEADGGDKDAYVDGLIARAKMLLGDDYGTLFDVGLDSMLGDIREDLEEFGVVYDNFFSERELTRAGTVDKALKTLSDNGNTYEKEGALWFRATDFGDDKDRVLVRANGQRTYIAPDIAYHLDKRLRGFDCLLDVLGSDHHGYVARVRAGLEALGQPGDSLEVRLMQFVSLYEGEKKVPMTTRGGQFVTLRELREAVGNDAARFFYVMRSNDQHLDFDMELARKRREDNPVYYVQYAHARICSVMRQLDDNDKPFDRGAATAAAAMLEHDKEQALLKSLGRYPDVVAQAARDRAPQTLVHYLRELTAEYHSFYNACRIMVDDDGQRNARAALNLATGQVIRNGLSLLGVSAPERM